MTDVKHTKMPWLEEKFHRYVTLRTQLFQHSAGRAQRGGERAPERQPQRKGGAGAHEPPRGGRQEEPPRVRPQRRAERRGGAAGARPRAGVPGGEATQRGQGGGGLAAEPTSRGGAGARAHSLRQSAEVPEGVRGTAGVHGGPMLVTSSLER